MNNLFFSKVSSDLMGATGCPSGGESLLAKTEPRVDITAIKMGQQPGQLIVRLVNLSDEELTEVLHLDLQVAVPLEPFEIATLALELET